jgi:phospholipid/cholesterol/gamma-HCH transport system permease protein
VQHFWVGMGKAPLFAFLIASIGCLEGMRVSGSAESVGEHTTSSVVRSIFGVILLECPRRPVLHGDGLVSTRR